MAAEGHQSTKLVEVTEEQRSLFNGYFISTSAIEDAYIGFAPKPWEETFVSDTLDALKRFSCFLREAEKEKAEREVTYQAAHQTANSWKAAYMNKVTEFAALKAEVGFSLYENLLHAIR